MLRFVVRRLIATVPLLVGLIVFLFILLELAPGDPLQALIGEYPVPEQTRAELSKAYNLDGSVIERFWSYASHLVRGDLGYSYANRQSVSGLVWSRLPNTLLLAGSGVALAALFGTLLGVAAAASKRASTDTATTTFTLLGYSIPNFWLGQILVSIFALKLGWLPSQGIRNLRESATGYAVVTERMRYLALPAIALCLREAAAISRVARASARATLSQDYIETAYAKGLRKSEVLRGHVLRNSLVPVATVTGYRFSAAIAGTVVIEAVFSWPGVGQLFIGAIDRRDNAVVLGVFVVVAVLIVLINLCTDVLYAFLDPRIRLT